MPSLRAQRRSPETLRVYGDGVRFYLHWCTPRGERDPLARDNLRAKVAHLVQAGMAPTTIRARQLPFRRFAAWLTEEGEVPADLPSGCAHPNSTSRSSSCSATTSCEPSSPPSSYGCKH